MSIKLTSKQLFQSFPAFSQLVNERMGNGNQRLAYNLSKTFRSLKTETEALREQELEIFKSFGATETDGRVEVPYKDFTKKKQKDFDAQLKGLQEIEIEVWGHPMTISEIEKANINLTPAQFELLDWLIIEDEPAPTPPTE